MTDAVLNALSDGNWHKVDEVANKSGASPRCIRYVAEYTGEIISGDLGYKRADMATAPEIRRSVQALRSRARKLTNRANDIESKFLN